MRDYNVFRIYDHYNPATTLLVGATTLNPRTRLST